MIKLITGKKGSGKTKVLVDMISESCKSATGNIVCIEKGMKLTYDLPHKVRLVDAEEYKINSFDTFYGFTAGMLAGNYDIQEIFVDGILKMGGKDYAAFSDMIDKLNSITANVKVIFTVSCDESDLPASAKAYL